MTTAAPQSIRAPIKPKQKTAWDHAEPFVLGGLSGMFATAIIQPMDMVKVRETAEQTALARCQADQPRAPSIC